jgi:hypothetical protein
MNFTFENQGLNPSFFSPAPSIAFLNHEIVYTASDSGLCVVESFAWLPSHNEFYFDSINNKQTVCQTEMKPSMDKPQPKIVTTIPHESTSSSSELQLAQAYCSDLAKNKESPAPTNLEIPAKCEMKKKETTNKRDIKFTYGSSQRKNVDKHMVRITSSTYQKFESAVLEDLPKYGIPLSEYDEAKQILQMLRKSEVKVETGVKKDYSKVINMFLNKRCILVVLKYSLESSLEHFAEGKKVPRVTEANKKVYRTTLNEYLTFVAQSLNDLTC